MTRNTHLPLWINIQILPYSTGPFTGESRDASTPFRYGTKYIKFMVLQNFNGASQVPQDHIWALDKIFFGKVIGNVDYRNIL